MIILNSKIWSAIVDEAKRKAANSPEWLRAIDRAVVEINRSKYWAFDAQTGTLKLISTTSGEFYTINAGHNCPATANGHTACKHKAALRLMQRYAEALTVTDNAPPIPAADCLRFVRNGQFTGHYYGSVMI